MKKGRAGSRARGRRQAGKAGGSGMATGVGGALPFLEVVPRGMPGAGAIMTAMWPIVALAALSGVAFSVAKWVISNVRRHIYNRNRNRKYAESGHSRRHAEKEGKAHGKMAWRTEAPRSRRKVPLPPPPGFAEDLRRQWDKLRDSPEEAVRFGEMMVELEDYVDNAFIFDDAGEIVGRHPGIKGFLAAECPHIGYSTALRYRILAMKAREIARKQGNLAKVGAQCRTACELGRRIDTALGITHYRLEHPRRQARHKKADRRPQPAIFSIREEARSAGKLDAPRRQRVVNALLEVAQELAIKPQETPARNSGNLSKV